MKTDSQPTCDSCRFWDETFDGDGLCRRHAPRAMPERMLMDQNEDVNRFVAFPLTTASDWCGEHITATATHARGTR
jgi:hypothetical protein